MKLHILIYLNKKIENIAMLLKFPTLRYNNFNRAKASKAKIEKSCLSSQESHPLKFLK